MEENYNQNIQENETNPGTQYNGETQYNQGIQNNGDTQQSTEYTKVPVKKGFWQSFKAFWLQPVVLELTPHQKKVFQEVHDFWNQEVHVENGNVVLRKVAITEPQVKVSL